MSPCRSLFAASPNLSTRTRGFCMLAHSTGGPGEWTPVEMVDRILLWKFQSISSTFTLWKGQISLRFGMPPPSRWPPFEHSSTKVGSLDIDPVYSTLCPRIQDSTSKFHLDTFQYSIEGAVVLDTIIYGQDGIVVPSLLIQYKPNKRIDSLTPLVTPLRLPRRTSLQSPKSGKT